jgi:hypothetical protein
MVWWRSLLVEQEKSSLSGRPGARGQRRSQELLQPLLDVGRLTGPSSARQARTKMRRRSLLLPLARQTIACLGVVALVALGCGRQPTPSPEQPAKSAVLAAHSAPAMASVTTPAPRASTASPSVEPSSRTEPLEYEPSLSDEATALFERELLIARKAVTDKQYDAAIRHYTKALSTGRNDAGCLGERGYVHLLAKRTDDAVRDLWFAAGARGSDQVLAQVWYNLGVAFRETQPERARAAFARSLALNPSRQAKSKLGAQSTCQTSTITSTALGSASATPVVSGWLGVHGSLGLQGEPASEAQARSIVCSTHSKFDFLVARPEPDCTDAPPWNLSCCSGPGGFMVRYMTVIPRPKNRFFTIDHGPRGGWPRECQGAAMPEQTIYGGVLVLKTFGSEIEPNGDFDVKRLLGADGEPIAEAPCRSGPDETTIDIYQLDTGQHLFELSSPTQSAPHFSVSADGSEALIQGRDCDAKLALR